MGADEIRLAATYADEKASDIRGRVADVADWTGALILENVYEEDWHGLVEYADEEIRAARMAIDEYTKYIEKLEDLKNTIKEETK